MKKYSRTSLSRSDLHASESLRVPRGGKPRVLTRSRSTVIKVDHRSRSRPVRTEIRTVGGQTEAARAFRSTIERSVDVDRSAKSGGNVVRCAERYRLAVLSCDRALCNRRIQYTSPRIDRRTTSRPHVSLSLKQRDSSVKLDKSAGEK